jgi:hypothetical protein
LSLLLWRMQLKKDEVLMVHTHIHPSIDCTPTTTTTTHHLLHFSHICCCTHPISNPQKKCTWKTRHSRYIPQECIILQNQPSSMEGSQMFQSSRYVG